MTAKALSHLDRNLDALVGAVGGASRAIFGPAAGAVGRSCQVAHGRTDAAPRAAERPRVMVRERFVVDAAKVRGRGRCRGAAFF